MKRFIQLILAGLACAVLFGCAHPITMNPDLGAVKAVTAPIDQRVALYIAEASKSIEVTTSAGGGDKVRYFPYRDMEPGLYKALSDTFREVTMVRDLGGLDKLRTEGKALLITPTITTQSSSESIVTWPPTQFTVELSCKVTDAAGKTIETVNVSGQGRATFDEFKGNFSLAATRASTDALTKLVKALGESASLRSQ